MSLVNPRLKVGFANETSSVDSLQVAFSKFNEHTHSTVLPQNLLFYNVSLDDLVTVSGLEFSDPFSSIINVTPLTVTKITEDYIELSRTSNRTTTCKLFIANGTTIDYLVVTAGSNQLRLDLASLFALDLGTISSSTLAAINTQILVGHWPITKPQNTPTNINPPGSSINYTVSINSGAYQVSTFSGFNPELTLIRGNTYNFQLDPNIQDSGGFHLVSEISDAILPFEAAFRRGVEFVTVQGKVTTIIFRVPLDAPNTLYYQSGIAGYRYGRIKTTPSVRLQDMQQYSLLQLDLTTQLPSLSPIVTIPVLINSPSIYRLNNVHVMPFWDSGFTPGNCTIRLFKQSGAESTNLSNLVQITQFGKVRINLLRPELINTDDSIVLEVYNHAQLLGLSHQIDLFKIN